MAGAPRRGARAPGRAAATFVLVAGLLAGGSGLAAPPASAQRPGELAAPVAWAYGGTAETAATGTDGLVEYGYTDHSNYAVILNETGDGGATLNLSLTRVLGTSGFIAACFPNCSQPREFLRGSSSGYEFEAATLELTRNAEALENGTEVPALGLAAERLELVGNLSVQFVWENLTDPDAPGVEWFNATTEANTTGNFSAGTPLGLVPTSPAPGRPWSGAGSYFANATTSYGGRLAYAGDLLPRINATVFGGTTSPISPMQAGVNGTDLGSAAAPAPSGSAALALTPSADGTSLLEGALLVPTSAYFFAAFASDCYLAQRPCLADAATPTLDYDRNASGHLGWEAAVSSISAFACWFDPTAVNDTPDGASFWSPATGIGPAGAPRALPGRAAPLTVTGLPIPVSEAVATQNAWHPSVAPNVTRPSQGPPPGVPPSPPGPSPGPSGGVGVPPATPARSSPATVQVPLPYVLAAVGATAALALLAVGTRRRRAPRRPPPEVEAEAAATASERPAEGGDEPMGYAW